MLYRAETIPWETHYDYVTTKNSQCKFFVSMFYLIQLIQAV